MKVSAELVGVDEREAPVLKSLIESPEPFITVKKLEAIAGECDVSYSEIVAFINGCRSHHEEMRKCLYEIAKKYRPGILKSPF